MANPSLYELALDETASSLNHEPGSGNYEVPDDLYNNKMDRAAELKNKELFRKGKLQYEDNGELIHDSNAMIRAKEVANAGIRGVDWLLEATENIGDFGQGDWIDRNNQFKAENQGREYNMHNKDFIGARETNTDQLVRDYQNALEDPNAESGIYTLRKFDGYNSDGTDKYIYKYGKTGTSADKRYRDQYVQDGFEIVEEKRFAGASDWEAKWNASQDVLDARVFDSGTVNVDGQTMSRDEASGVNFGDGKTELLNEDLLGTDVGKTQADYNANRAYSEKLSSISDEEGYHDNSILGRSLNTVAGGLSMLTKTLVVDTVDWVGEITGIGDLATEEEKTDFTQGLFGYDDHFSKQNMAEIKGNINKMMENGFSWDGMKAVLGNAVANVETTGESLGYLVGLFAGVGKFTKVGQGLSRIEKAKKAGLISAEVAASRTEKLMRRTSATERATYQLGKQAGLINTTAGKTNNDIDAFKENNDGEGPTGAHVGFMYLNNLIALGTDRWTDMSILRSSGVLSSAKKSLEGIASKHLPSVVNEIARTGAVLAANMGKEAVQEYYQTMSEQLNVQYGTDKYGSDFFELLTSDENVLDALTGSAAGAGGAVHFQIAGSGIDAIRGQVNKQQSKKETNAVESNTLTDLDGKVKSSSEPVGLTQTNKIQDPQNQQVFKTIEEDFAAPAKSTTNEDGTVDYDQEDVTREYTELYDKLITKINPILKDINSGNLDIENAPLGTARAVSDKFKNAIRKIDRTNLTPEKETELKAVITEAILFDKELNKVFESKVKKYSLAEIDAMSADQAVTIFGSSINETSDTFDQDFDSTGLDFDELDSILDGQSDNASLDTDTVETETDELDFLDDIESGVSEETAEKKSKIAGKTGDNKKEESFKKQAKSKKQTRETIETIRDRNLFDKDTGTIAKVAKLLDSGSVISEANNKIAEVEEFTKEWLVKEGAAESVDKVTQQMVDDFIAPGTNEFNRKEYFNSINKSNMISIKDAKRIISNIAKSKTKLREDIYKKINELVDRDTKYTETIESMIETIKNETNKKPKTKKQLYKDIQNKINNKDEVRLDKKFEEPYPDQKKSFKIMYDDVKKNMDDKNSRTGVFKVLDNMEEEVKILFSLVEDENEFKIDDVLNDEIIKREKKKLEKDSKDLNKSVDGDEKVEFLTPTELKRKREKLEKLKIKLDKTINDISNDLEFEEVDVNLPQGGKRISAFTRIQNQFVENLDVGIRELFREYLDYKNTSARYGENAKKVNSELRAIGFQIKELKKERDAKVKELNEKQGTNLTKEEWNKLAKTQGTKEYNKTKKDLNIFQKMFRNAISILNKLLNINNQLDDLYLEQEKLRNDYNDLKSNEQMSDMAANITEKKLAKKTNIVNVNKNLLTKEEHKKNKKAIIERAIKKIEKDIMAPHVSASLLLKQSNRIKNAEKTNDEKIPDDLSTYISVSKKSRSLFSSIDIETLASENENLKKMMNDGVNFIMNSGLAGAISHFKTREYIDIMAPAMSLLTNRDSNSLDEVKKTEINKNFATAVVIASKEAIRNQSTSLYIRSNSEIADLLGVKERDLTSEQKGLFRHQTRVANMAYTIGSSIASMMDFKMKSDGNSEAYSRFITSAGMIGVMHMIDNGDLVLNNEMSLKDYNEVMNIDMKLTKKQEKATVNFLERPKDSKGNYIPFDIKKLNEDKAILLELTDADNKIIPVDVNSVQFVRPEIQTASEVGVRENPYMDPSQEVADAINNLQQQEHKIMENSINNYILDFDPDKKTREANIEAKKKKNLERLGYREDQVVLDDKTKGFDDKEAEIAANKGILREYEELQELAQEIADKKRENNLWFNYFTPRNGRLNIQSVLIDPQNGKELHRWLVLPRKAIQRYNKNSISKIKAGKESTYGNQVGFLLAIAQAFDFDIDKRDISKSIEYAQEILGKDIATIEKEYLDTNTFDHYGHALQAIEAIKTYQDTKTNSFYAGITVEFDGITNGTILKLMQMPIIENSAGIALKGGIAIDNSNTEMKNQSGVTYDNFNGTLENSEETYNVQKKNIENYEEFKKTAKEGDEFIGEPVPILDVYYSGAVKAELKKEEVIGRMTHSVNDKGEIKIKNDRFNLVDTVNDTKNYIMDFIPDATGVLTKELREIFKYPTMIINYGGSLISVENSVAKDATRNMISKLLKDFSRSDKKLTKEELDSKHNRAKEILEHIGRKIGIKDAEAFAEELRTKSLYKIGVRRSEGTSYNLESDLIETFKSAAGEAVSGSIKDTFGPMIDITNKINESSRVSFRAFELALNNEIIKLIEEKKNSKNDQKGISPSDMIELIKKLKPLLPVYEGPGSIDKLIDGIAIFKAEVTPNSEQQYGNSLPSVKATSKDDFEKNEDGTLRLDSRTKKPIPKIKSMNARTFSKRIASAYASAGVLPTHTEDGYDMSKTINDIIKKYGITPIHDAISVGGIGTNGILQIANKNIIETSEGFDSVNSVAIGMRESYEAAKQYEIDNNISLNLDEMRTEEEIAKKKDSIGDNEIYVPLSYKDAVMEMEQDAEVVWSNKHKVYANDIIIDHMPGYDSAYKREAIYEEQKYIDEMNTRVNRRLEDMDSATKKIFSKDNIKNMFKFNSTSKVSETDKINYIMEQIDLMTKILNGEC